MGNHGTQSKGSLSYFLQGQKKKKDSLTAEDVFMNVLAVRLFCFRGNSQKASFYHLHYLVIINCRETARASPAIIKQKKTRP